MAKPVIKEVIVVEGYHDSAHLKKYYDCDTIITSGSGISKQIMDEIRRANDARGVIIFTDPDFPGVQIRNKINDAIPGCKNAFVMKKDARTSKKVGVEHATFPVLDEALKNLITIDEIEREVITMDDMIDLKLIGQLDSKQRREYLAEKLHIGVGNAKSLKNKLNCLGITRHELEEEMKSYE